MKPYICSMRIVVITAALGILLPLPRAADLNEADSLASWVDIYKAPAESDVLKSLRPKHPRLMVLPIDLDRIKQSIATDATAKKYYQQLLRTAIRDHP